MHDAIVIGAGPNGLVAANKLADAGWKVLVLEEQPEPGGAVKTAEVIEPGFRHDLFSAFYPLAAASPAIRALELERHGLRWRRSPLVLAHPSSDGTCVVLSRDIEETAASLESFAAGDGDQWRRLFRLWRRVGGELLDGMARPLPPVHAGIGLARKLGPGGLLRFIRLGLLPVRRFAEEQFRGDGAARLLAGNALHADLGPESSLGGFFGWLLCSLGQDVGFPFPEGGAGSLTDALVRRLEHRGGAVRCGDAVAEVLVRRGRAVAVRTGSGLEVEAAHAVLADTTAPSLYLDLLPRPEVPTQVLAALQEFQWDNGTFKVDWALDGPIPWTSEEARRASVIHVAEGVDELTEWSGELARGLIPVKPFLVFGQYSMGDPSRCPPGKEVAWAYTHVPQRIRGDAGGTIAGVWDEHDREAMVDRIEALLQELAPGFGALVRGRHVQAPPDLERANRNLVNGALNGGTAQLHQQLVYRPAAGLGRPETPVRRLYLASASAHPGGGVHGGPGVIAARAALRHARLAR